MEGGETRRWRAQRRRDSGIITHSDIVGSAGDVTWITNRVVGGRKGV